MRSATSLFSPALFRKNLTRYAPLWAIFLLLMILYGPVSVSQVSETYNPYQYSSLDHYFFGHREIVAAWNFLYAPLCAGLLFRYLHKARSAYMMHAFPLNRSTQFVTNILSGLSFALVPFLLQFALNLLVSIGMSGQAVLWKLLLIEILSFLFFFGLAVFCMQLTGNTIIAVLSYFVLNFAFAAIPALLLSLVNTVCFGFDLSASDRFLPLLSPALRMMFPGLYPDDPVMTEWLVYGIYGMLGCVLLLLAWLQYQKRPLEQAGEAMVFRWAKLGFLLLFTAIVTLGLGMLLTDGFCRTNGPVRSWFVPMLLFYLLASFLGWFGAQMMVNRTVRVFRKRQMLAWACIAAAVAMLIGGLCFDVFGRQRYVPEKQALQQVTVTLDTVNQTYLNRYSIEAELTVTDPEVYDAILDAQSDAYLSYTRDGKTYENEFSVQYVLKSGKTVRRQFSAEITDMYLLKDLLNRPEYAVQYYRDIVALMQEEENPLFSLDSEAQRQMTINCTDAQALGDALLRDAAEGNLPIPFHPKPDSFVWTLNGDHFFIWIDENAKHTLGLFLIPKQ